MEDKGSVVLWLIGDGRGRRHGALRVKEASVIEERPITQSTINYNNFFFNKKQRKNCRVFFSLSWNSKAGLEVTEIVLLLPLPLVCWSLNHSRPHMVLE